MIWKSFLFVSCIVAAVQCLTQSELKKIDEALQPTISSKRKATAFVRLAFHDCVGGCDGCININNPENAGLEKVIDGLEEIYNSNGFKSVLSRADFWAYAGQAALRQTVDWTKGVEQSDLKIKFQTGRIDCPSSPHTTRDVELPSSNIDYEELINFFDKRFGMNDEQAVALMGAHTLGYAHKKYSGFSGMWVPKEESFQFTNNYYKVMRDLKWWQINVGGRTDERWQWEATVRTGGSIPVLSEKPGGSRPSSFEKPGGSIPSGLDKPRGSRPSHTKKPGGSSTRKEHLMMLNADFCMLKELELNEDGLDTCGRSGCGFSSGAKLVNKFADSQSLWLEKFSEAFTIMQSSGKFTLSPFKPSIGKFTPSPIKESSGNLKSPFKQV